jgi:hypothetical protein
VRLVDRWLDSWSGIGLVVVGMTHQGYQVSLGEHGASRWIAVLSWRRRPRARGDGGDGEEATPWRAVQRAAWEALET